VTPSDENEGPRRRRAAAKPPFEFALCDYANFFVQKFGRKVGAIWPNDRSNIRIQSDLLEVIRIAEGLENRAPQLSREIDLTLRSVFEMEPNRMPGDVTSFNDVEHV